MNKEKIIRVLMLMSALILFTTSCSKDEESNNSTPTNSDNYYVKYEVLNGKQVLPFATTTDRTVKLKDVNREATVQITTVPWEGTYGPFKKGDKVYMTLSSSGRCNSIGRLSVSKNREAFAIKDEFWYSTNGRLEYTIDY